MYVFISESSKGIRMTPENFPLGFLAIAVNYKRQCLRIISRVLDSEQYP